MSCLYLAGPTVMRVTQVDQCGEPVTGQNAFVSDCFASVSLNPNIDTVDDLIYRRGNGTVCATKPGCSSLLYYDVTIALNYVSPELIEIMTGNPVVLPATGTAPVGWDDCQIQCDAGFALEFWNETIAPTCDPAGNETFLYFLLPWLTSAYISDLELSSDAASIEIVGKTRAGGGWGVGPYNVMPGAGGTPGPMLTPLGATCHRRVMSTTVAPPTASCDYVAVP